MGSGGGGVSAVKPVRSFESIYALKRVRGFDLCDFCSPPFRYSFPPSSIKQLHAAGDHPESRATYLPQQPSSSAEREISAQKERPPPCLN